MRHDTMRKVQDVSSWVLACALAIDLTINIIAYTGEKISSRRWDQAMKEDIERAKTEEPAAD